MGYFGAKHYAIKKQFEEKFSGIPETPGIYLGTRYDPDINKTYFYVGQAESLRNRRFDYYKIQTGIAGPQGHFQASLKAHRGQDIKDENGNVIGKDSKGEYQIICQCSLNELDNLEKKYIHEYKCKDNYITRNTQHGDSDIVKSNYNRLDRIQKKFDKKLVKLLKHLIIELKENQIIISPELKKNGEPTKLAQDSFNDFNKMIQDAKKEKVEENENNSNIINNENKEINENGIQNE